MDFSLSTPPKERISIVILLVFSVTLGAYHIDIGFSLLPYMMVCALMFLYGFFNFKIPKLRPFEIALMVFFLYYCSTGLFAKFPESSLRLILGVWLVFFCYFVMRHILFRTSIEGIEKAIGRTGIIFNLLSLLLYFLGLAMLSFNFSGNGIRHLGVLIDRGFPRLIGTFYDPNFFCFGNLLFFFYYLTHLHKKSSKFGLLLTSMTLLLTNSRGGGIALAAGLIVVFFSVKPLQKIKMLLFIPLFAFFINLLCKFIFSIDLYTLMIERFETSDNGSGRFDIWMHGLTMFQDHPFFGIGIFNYRSYNLHLYGDGHFMHNTFLEVLTESGVIGFLLYIIVFISIFLEYFSIRRYGTKARYLLMAFFSMVILMNSLSVIVNESMFLIFALLQRYLFEADRTILQIKQKNISKHQLTQQYCHKNNYELESYY
ncbi:O-antigen ligase family protein [Neobacillus sp. GCM10023253]|uniref:O-antigen ligase family protein n=1 Tax=Neobacillus sp. GCM10023253 TaxID=3252644 RepID=UPI00360E72FE